MVQRNGERRRRFKRRFQLWRAIQSGCATGPVSVVRHNTSWGSTIISALKVKLVACSSIAYESVGILIYSGRVWAGVNT